MRNFYEGGRGLCYLKRLSHLFKSKNNRSLALFSFVLSLICVLFSDAQAQSAGERAANGLREVQPIIVGQKVPDDFWTKEHLFYSNGDTVRKTMGEFKGKPLIIDFWATWCISCIQGFPKLSVLQDKYKDRLNVLLANSRVTRDDYSKIHSMKDNILRKSNLTTVYNDDYLASIFHYVAIPHYIWINPKGVVSGVTFSEFVNEDQVEVFINYNQKYEKDNQ